MTRHFLIVLQALLLCLPVARSVAQPTVEVRIGTTIRGVKFGDIASGDLLGNGRENLFILGELNNGIAVSSIYSWQQRTFDGAIQPPVVAAAFTELLTIPLIDFSYGAVHLEDMDGNGELDIILSGRTQAEAGLYRALSGIYINHSTAQGQPSFEWRAFSGLPNLGDSRLETADFDGDGAPDIVIGGVETDGTVQLAVYLNRITDGISSFRPAPYSLPPISPTMISAGDFDGDGDQDLLVGGRLDGETHVVRLFENTEDGLVPRASPLPNLLFPGGEFGDFDGDGDDDILLTGGEYGPNLLQGRSTLWMSENGTFVPHQSTLPGVFYGEAEFADYEGDGDLDFFIEGLTDPADPTGPRLYIFMNNAGVPRQVADMRSLVFGGAAWIDYDNNGRLDIALTGGSNNARRVIIYEFNPQPNPPPPPG